MDRERTKIIAPIVAAPIPPHLMAVTRSCEGGGSSPAKKAPTSIEPAPSTKQARAARRNRVFVLPFPSGVLGSTVMPQGWHNAITNGERRSQLRQPASAALVRCSDMPLGFDQTQRWPDDEGVPTVKIREGLSNAPFAVAAVATGLPMGLGLLFIPPLIAPGPGHWVVSLIGAAVAGTVFGVIMAHIIRNERSRMGGVDTAVSVNRAIASRTAPPDAVSSEWLSALEHRKRQATELRWWGPLLFGILSLVGASVALGGVVVAWFGWAEAVIFGGLAVFYVVWPRRQLLGIAEIEAQLAPPARPQLPGNAE